MDLFSYFKVPVQEPTYLDQAREFAAPVTTPVAEFLTNAAQHSTDTAQLVYSTISENWQHLDMLDGHQVISDSMIVGVAGSASALLGLRAVKNYRKGNTLLAVVQAPLAGLAALGTLHTLAGLSREALQVGAQTV